MRLDKKREPVWVVRGDGVHVTLYLDGSDETWWVDIFNDRDRHGDTRVEATARRSGDETTIEVLIPPGHQGDTAMEMVMSMVDSADESYGDRVHQLREIERTARERWDKD